MVSHGTLRRFGILSRGSLRNSNRLPNQASQQGRSRNGNPSVGGRLARPVHKYGSFGRREKDGYAEAALAPATVLIGDQQQLGRASGNAHDQRRRLFARLSAGANDQLGQIASPGTSNAARFARSCSASSGPPFPHALVLPVQIGDPLLRAARRSE